MAGGGLAFLAPKANTLGAWELGAAYPGKTDTLGRSCGWKNERIVPHRRGPGRPQPLFSRTGRSAQGFRAFPGRTGPLSFGSRRTGRPGPPGPALFRKTRDFHERGKAGATPEAFPPTRSRDPLDRGPFTPIRLQDGARLCPPGPRTRPWKPLPGRSPVGPASTGPDWNQAACSGPVRTPITPGPPFYIPSNFRSDWSAWSSPNRRPSAGPNDRPPPPPFSLPTEFPRTLP